MSHMVKTIDKQNVTTVVGAAIGAAVGAALWSTAGAAVGAAVAILFLRELTQRF